MSIREDITINWSVSPRIIEVAAPSTILTVQDLYDTLCYLGAAAIGEPEIVDASGKETLGSDLLVGLTVKLLNAKVKFEDRLLPTDCNVSGGNLIACNADGESMNPIQYATCVTATIATSTSGALLRETTSQRFDSRISGGLYWPE